MDFEKYKTQSEFPKFPKKPILNKKHTSEEAEEYVQKLKHYESLIVEYNEQIKEIRKETHRLENQFRDDLLQENGYNKEDPIGLRVFNRAWELGHSSGLHEVASHFSDVNDFVEDILKLQKGNDD